MGALAAKTKEKKLTRQEENLKAINQDLSFQRMKSGLAVSLTFMAIFYFLNRRYFHSIPFETVIFSFDGIIVARLPFEPISWLQGISHRNIA
jgi:hypothetical protein